jgi:hypothetical protein
MIPFFGELGDFIYAPFYGIAIYSLYKVRLSRGKAALGAVAGAIEEILPFTDIIPTASLMWAYTYKVKRHDTLRKFALQIKGDEETLEDVFNPKPVIQKQGLLKRLSSSIISIFYEAPSKQPAELELKQIEISPQNDSEIENI